MLSSGHGPLLGYTWQRLHLVSEGCVHCLHEKAGPLLCASDTLPKSLRKYFNKKICFRPVSLFLVNSHTTRGPTADSTHLANDTVHSRGYCLDLRRKLRFARDSLRAVRSRRSFRAALSKLIAMCTAMCSRGAGQCGRACSLTCPADLLARVPAMCSQGTCIKETVN